MNLAQAIASVAEQNRKASQPADLAIGTVQTVGPLTIILDTAQAPLTAPVLLLTETVMEKKIPVLSHTHQISTLGHDHTGYGGDTSMALTGTYTTQSALDFTPVTENGVVQPVENGYIIINRGLAKGDKVLLFRSDGGQRYIVLSRVFEGVG